MTASFDVVASFDDVLAARRAADELRRDSFAPMDVALDESLGASSDRVETRFFGRVVLIIVWWSIVGGAVGAALGWAFAQTGIGPGGATGLVLQIISWAIFGHLIAGMWAGYLLLADRSQREFSPDRSSGIRATVTVHCNDRRQIDAARRTLSEHRPRSMRESARSV